MSDNSVDTFTIQVGVSGTFSWDPYGDISTYINNQIALAPTGDNIVIDIEPGVYGVVKPILLPSNTSVIGNDATLQPLPYSGWEGNTGIFVNADAYSLNSTETYVKNVNGTSSILVNAPPGTTVMDPASPGIIDTNISVEGITFNDTGYWIFGTWFTNAKNVDVQNNTYIGGPDGNAFVDVTNGIVAGNIAVGQVNAAYDNWDGPTNITIEDNSTYMSGTPNSGWSFLLNACLSGNPANPGDSVNDGVVGNLFSGYWINGSSGNADPLENNGPITTESDITQQGNIISSLNIPEAGSSYSANVVSQDIIQDDLFTGTNFPSSDRSSVICALSSSSSLASNAQILGNLILGAYNDSNGAALIVNSGNSPTTSNNAIIGGGSDGNGISTTSLNGTSSSSGNIVMTGTSINGSGVLPMIGIGAPPNLYLSPGSSTEISGLVVDDLDTSDRFSITVGVIFGTLSLPDDAQGTVSWGAGANENNLTLVGNLSDINNDLASLSYVGPLNGWDDSIEVNVSTTSGLAATRYIPVLEGTAAPSTDELTILPSGYMGTLISEGLLPSADTLLGAPSLNGEIAIASSGNNLINLGSTISVAFLGSGSNTLEGGSNPEYIAGGLGNVFVSLGGGGDVTVAAASGSAYIDAATGNNLIEIGSSTATLLAGLGSNTVAGGLGQATVLGGTGPLYLVSLPQDGGDMNVILGSGASTVLALSGNSSITTQPNTDNLIFAGIGNNLIQSSGNDTIYTGTGSATILASTNAADKVSQGSGSLTFVSSSSESSTIISAGGDLSVSGKDPTVYVLIDPGTGLDRTIALGGISAGVSLGGDLSIEHQSIDDQTLSVTLSDGTVLELLDVQKQCVIDLAGQLSFTTNTLSLEANTYTDLASNYTDGQAWSVVGSSVGGDTVNTTIPKAFIVTSGTNNVVGLISSGDAVISDGAGDILVGFGGNNTITVEGTGAGVLIRSGADTVYAAPGCSSLNAFFVGSAGGQLDFINQSSNSVSVTGGADGASGSVTVFGGSGGGYYEGGDSGSNLLIGGSGSSSTTLIGAGTNSFLSVGGSGYNALFSGDGNATLVAGFGTSNNIFALGASTNIVSSEGSGSQAYFFGDFGSDTIFGSTVSGATNNYYFNQTSSDGGGTACIINFNFSKDAVYINPNGQGSDASVMVQSTSDLGSGTIISFSNNTSVILSGTSLSQAQQAALLGATHF